MPNEICEACQHKAHCIKRFGHPTKHCKEKFGSRPFPASFVNVDLRNRRDVERQAAAEARAYGYLQENGEYHDA